MALDEIKKGDQKMKQNTLTCQEFGDSAQPTQYWLETPAGTVECFTASCDESDSEMEAAGYTQLLERYDAETIVIKIEDCPDMAMDLLQDLWVR